MTESIKKETLTQVFSCEFFEICKNTFLTEHFLTTASEINCIKSVLSGLERFLAFESPLKMIKNAFYFTLKAHFVLWRYFNFCLKVSEYLFKQNTNTLKNIKVLLYTYFYDIYLNVLRPTFFNICTLPFSHFPNIRKIRVKVGPKTNYFSYFMSSCSDRIVVFNNFLSFILSQAKEKQNRALDFFLFKYFLNNLLLTIFMQNRLSKLVEVLQ